ncbi:MULTISPECIES: hypothetical protein [Bacteroidales]|uniref:hypothetical protein n=1 Tax=Bacteroidales TaxID=171549 RepID=UPI0025B6C3BE|nr:MULTISPECIES: hypothetical protein [Bacteroidales]
MKNTRFTPENIAELAPNEVFVFGSNKAGNHAGGAARIAVEKFGAQIGSSGDGAKIESSGKNSVVAAIGVNSIVKAKLGSWITLAEYDDDRNPLCVKSAQIDGGTLKEDVFYQLKGGKFVKVKE